MPTVAGALDWAAGALLPPLLKPQWTIEAIERRLATAPAPVAAAPGTRRFLLVTLPAVTLAWFLWTWLLRYVAMQWQLRADRVGLPDEVALPDATVARAATMAVWKAVAVMVGWAVVCYRRRSRLLQAGTGLGASVARAGAAAVQVGAAAGAKAL